MPNQSRSRQLVDHTPPSPQRIVPTPEQVLTVLADNQYRYKTDAVAATPLSLSMVSIAKKILGFDPTQGKQAATYGGKSAEGWIDEHLSVRALKRVLTDLEGQGSIVKINGPTYRSSPEEKARAQLVRFEYRSRSGYVLTDSINQASARRNAQTRNHARRKLLKQAQATVLQAHANEVDSTYLRLCREANLNPAQEGD